MTRYYCASGAGGVAVGVHTTQFAIRDPQIGLFAPVLRLAMETAREFESENNKRLVKIAGVCGPTAQAVNEAALAREIGYDAGLLSLSALGKATNAELIEHCRRVAEVIPLFGFYLQPAVGGRLLDDRFWREFLEIENVVAIKVAPFNRYQTLDVARALARSAEVTDANAVLFDARNNFAGCIAGLHEILRRQGLLAGRWCLDPREELSPGQMEEIDRICAQYPNLNDDNFVEQNLEQWLR